MLKKSLRRLFKIVGVFLVLPIISSAIQFAQNGTNEQNISLNQSSVSEFEFETPKEEITVPINSRDIVVGTYKCAKDFDFKTITTYKIAYFDETHFSKIIDNMFRFTNGNVLYFAPSYVSKVAFKISIEINKKEIATSDLIKLNFVPDTKIVFNMINVKKYDVIIPKMRIAIAEISYNPYNLDLSFEMYKNEISTNEKVKIHDSRDIDIKFEIVGNTVFYIVPEWKIDHNQFSDCTTTLSYKNSQGDKIYSIYHLNSEKWCPNKTVEDTEVFVSANPVSMSTNYYSRTLRSNDYNSFEDEMQLAYSYNYTIKDKIGPVTNIFNIKDNGGMLPLFNQWYFGYNQNFYSDEMMNYCLGYTNFEGWEGKFIDENGDEVKNWSVEQLFFNENTGRYDPNAIYDYDDRGSPKNSHFINDLQFGFLTVGVVINTPKHFGKTADYSETQKVNLVIGSKKHKFVLTNNYFNLSFNTKKTVFQYEDSDIKTFSYEKLDRNELGWCNNLGEYKITTNPIKIEQKYGIDYKKAFTIYVKNEMTNENDITCYDENRLFDVQLKYDACDSSAAYRAFEVFLKIKNMHIENKLFEENFFIVNKNQEKIWESEEKIKFQVSDNGSTYTIGNTWMSIYEKQISSAVTFNKLDLGYDTPLTVDFLDKDNKKIPGWEVNVINRGTFRIIDLIPDVREEKSVYGYLRIYRGDEYLIHTELTTYRILKPIVSVQTDDLNDVGSFQSGVSNLYVLKVSGLSLPMISITKEEIGGGNKWEIKKEIKQIDDETVEIRLSAYLAHPDEHHEKYLRQSIKIKVSVYGNLVFTSDVISFLIVRPEAQVNKEERSYSLWEAKQKNAAVLWTYVPIDLKRIKIFVTYTTSPRVWTECSKSRDEINFWAIKNERKTGEYNIDIENVGLTFSRKKCFMKIRILFDNEISYESRDFEEWVTQS